MSFASLRETSISDLRGVSLVDSNAINRYHGVAHIHLSNQTSMEELVFPKLITIAYSKSILKACHSAIATDEEEVKFDLSKSQFISPFGITILAGTISDCLLKEKKVWYTRPKHRPTRNFLTRIGFDDFFHLKKELTEIRESNIQLRKLVALDPSYTDQIISAFSRSLRMSEGVKGLLKLSLNETMSNAFEFAQSHKGCYGCAQVYPNAKRIRVCITDFGIGIRQSLMSSPKYRHLHDSFEAITLASKDGVTSRATGVGGKGLPTLLQFLGANRGRMVIVSGDGKVAWDFQKSKEPKRQGMSAEFGGTIVSMRIRTDARGAYIMKGESVVEDVF